MVSDGLLLALLLGLLYTSRYDLITLVGNSNDPPQKYCILDVIKRLINQSRLVKTGRNWSKLVETGPNWSKLSKLVETCNGLPCSKTNRTFI